MGPKAKRRTTRRTRNHVSLKKEKQFEFRFLTKIQTRCLVKALNKEDAFKEARALAVPWARFAENKKAQVFLELMEVELLGSGKPRLNYTEMRPDL